MRLLEFVLHHVYKDKYFPLRWSYYNDCAVEYSIFNARGKVVIDVGADWGCSPLVWRAQGAKKVVAFESENDLRERMAHFLGNQKWLEIRGAWKGEMPEGDAIKFDCEGCERGVDKEELLRHYPEVLLALHVHDPGFKGSHVRERETRLEYLTRKKRLFKVARYDKDGENLWWGEEWEEFS